MSQPEADTQRQIADLGTELAKLHGEVRVVKHDLAQVQMRQEISFRSIEKLDDKVSKRIDDFDNKVSSKFDILTERVAGLNAQHQKGLGFFAGIGFMITLPAGVVALIVKLVHP